MPALVHILRTAVRHPHKRHTHLGAALTLGHRTDLCQQLGARAALLGAHAVHGLHGGGELGAQRTLYSRVPRHLRLRGAPRHTLLLRRRRRKEILAFSDALLKLVVALRSGDIALVLRIALRAHLVERARKLLYLAAQHNALLRAAAHALLRLLRACALPSQRILCAPRAPLGRAEAPLAALSAASEVSNRCPHLHRILRRGALVVVQRQPRDSGLALLLRRQASQLPHRELEMLGRGFPLLRFALARRQICPQQRHFTVALGSRLYQRNFRVCELRS